MPAAPPFPHTRPAVQPEGVWPAARAEAQEQAPGRAAVRRLPVRPEGFRAQRCVAFPLAGGTWATAGPLPGTSEAQRAAFQSLVLKSAFWSRDARVHPGELPGRVAGEQGPGAGSPGDAQALPEKRSTSSTSSAAAWNADAQPMACFIVP